MKTECPNAGMEGCPYKPCFADTDHVIPRFMGKGATKLVQNYIRSKANQQQLCRFEHDKKTREEWENPPELPTERFMIDAIKRVRLERKQKNGGQ